MKSTFRTMAIAACFALVSLTSCYFPGSDQYKIKSATKEYVKSQLGEGEKFRYGYLERKCGRNVDGKFCKYAEVHYEVISASGETSEKMLFSADVGTLRFRIGYLGGERQGVDQ